MSGHAEAELAQIDTPAGASGLPAAKVRLRLYIARLTPNSMRAEQNLLAAIHGLDEANGVELEIVDVFRHSKRAVTDGIIVTPTLIIFGSSDRILVLGDLADGPKLRALIVASQEPLRHDKAG